jgi:protocatechuate 3,4-dioxygenase beta subunit
MATNDFSPVELTRRDALIGIAALTGVAATARASWGGPATTSAGGSGVCVLTPQTTAGPYYFDPKLERADIREGKSGALLKLAVQVVTVGACAPVAGARVDVWHADALGAYSGYDRQSDRRDQSTVGQTFLRGTQIADRNGQVSFTTIYPGWYPGRTPHIHFKVFIDRRSALTGQTYFPDEVSDAVYADFAPYNRRTAKRDTSNARDGVLRADSSQAAFAAIKKEGEHHLASLVVALDRGPARS